MLPRLTTEFGVTLAVASYAVTLFAVAYGVSQLAFGPLGDRFGKYRVITMGTVACAVTALICAMVPSFDALLIARLMAGATVASIIPLAMAWIGDVIAYEDRQPVLAKFLIGQILGASSGQLIGGFAAEHLGWRAPFVLLAALFAVAALVLAYSLRRLPVSAKTLGETRSKGIRGVFGTLLSEFAAVIRVPWARVIVVTVTIEGALMFGAFAFLPTHLHLVYNLSLAWSGSMAMFFGAGGFLFALFSRVFVTRLGEVGMARLGASLMCAAAWIIAFAPQWWWAMPATFMVGLGFYMMHNTLQTNATQMAPTRRGAAVALFASLFFIGQSIGVATSGVAVSRFGTANVIAVCGAGLLVVGWLFARAKSRHLPQP